jgi:peptidoglycan/xylan/chitin deacetylase (PgdA/CDA1 family)
MSLIRKIILKVGREAALHIAKKNAYFPGKYRVISFTFDDFPCTAKENGARILEANKVYGTFYVSLGLAGQERNIGRIGTQHEMLELSQSGHELACHTFSHLNCAYKTDNLIREDCLKNQEAAMNSK